MGELDAPVHGGRNELRVLDSIILIRIYTIEYLVYLLITVDIQTLPDQRRVHELLPGELTISLRVQLHEKFADRSDILRLD